jgi:hypothetical protein
MKRAVFITGFNNWGKTSIIFELFGRKKFNYNKTYKIKGVNFSTEFTVESSSNDDLWGTTWVNQVQNRINQSPDNGESIVAALCPTMHDNNNFITLLKSTTFTNYDKLYILLIEYKWEHHAKLMIDNIVQAGKQVPNAHFIWINADQNLIDDADRKDAKIDQIKSELNNLFT